METRVHRETNHRLKTGPVMGLVIGLAIGALAVLAWMTLANDDNELGAGPRQDLDHWRVPYGLYSCTADADGEMPEQGGWLPHFDSFDDPLGIHSHDDGAISIHPFFADSAGENAVVGHFFDAMRAELHDDRLVLPDGTVLDETTPCPDGNPAVLHVRTWPDVWQVGVEAPTVITKDLAGARFRSGSEVWMFVHAPLDTELPPLPAERYLAARWLHDSGPVTTREGVVPRSTAMSDAERSRIAQNIGSALPMQNRLEIVDTVQIGDRTWIASNYPPQTQTALIAERYAARGFEPAGGEVVVVSDGRTRQSISTNGFPLTFIDADDAYVYAGRRGDGGYPHSALFRIDQRRFGAERIVFPEFDVDTNPNGNDASFWKAQGWTLGSAEQRRLFDSGDYAAVFDS